MSLLFDFSKINIVPYIGTEIDTKGNIKEFNKNITTYNIINKFVLELNNKLINIRNKNIRNQDIFFEIEFEREQHIETHNSTSAKGGPKLFIPDIEREPLFYLRLNIDGNLLNIFSAKAKSHSNGKMTFEDIKWQYNLSQEFMNYVYDNCILQQTNHPNLFYDIMLIYYQVVEKQIQDFVSNYNHYNAHNKIRQYIFFYNVYVKKKIFSNVLLLNNFRNNKFINFYDTNYYETLLLLINENIYNENFELKIQMDLYFFFIFFSFSTTNIKFNIEGELRDEILKKYMLYNLYNFKLTETQYSSLDREILEQRYIVKEGTKNIIINKQVTEKINNLGIHDKDFLLFLHYFLVYSNLDGLKNFIENSLNITFTSLINYTKNQKVKSIINLDNKTLRQNDYGKLTELKNPVVSIGKKFSIVNNSSTGEKMYDYNCFLDYKNRFINIKINIELKAYIIKLWTECKRKDIDTLHLINLINFFLKTDISNNQIQQILESLQNIEKKENNDNMLIISYNEAKQEFNSGDCIPIITKILKEFPAFIIIGTQESGTSLEILSKKGSKKFFGEASHYIHVFGELIKDIGYELYDKDRGHLTTLKTNNVRMRVYFNKGLVGGRNSIKISNYYLNKNKISLNPFKKIGKGAIFSFLSITKDGENLKKFIFVNADFSNNNNSNNEINEIFIKLMEKKLYGLNLSLLDMYNNKDVNIIFFGDVRIERVLRIKTKNSTGINIVNSNNQRVPLLENSEQPKTINNLKKNFQITTNNKLPQILSILPQITSRKIYQTYVIPDKSDNHIASLTFSLYGNNNQ